MTDGLGIARAALAEHRRRQDGRDAHVVFLPSECFRDFECRLAAAGPSRLCQVVFLQDEVTSTTGVGSTLWRQAARAGCSVQRIYVVPHKGFANGKLHDLRKDDQAAAIGTAVVVMSSLQADTSRLLLRPYYLVDDSTLVIRDRGDGPGASASWAVTVRDTDIDAARLTWDTLGRCASSEEDSTQVDLEEPLVTSADLMSGVADVLCTADHVDPSGCSWYHGTWQYLRLANLVSTPTWHHAFYRDRLRRATAAGATRILISGTADYSLLAYVMAAARGAPSTVEISVLDLCPTPLFACQWLAKRDGHRIRTIQENLLSCQTVARGAFSVVTTDAFLTRFSADEVPRILDAWHELLAPGGVVITTIRLHDLNPAIRDTEALVQAFVDRGRVALERWASFLQVPLEVLLLRTEGYARRMKSQRLAAPNEIPALFQAAGFDILFSEVAEVPGELQPTSYLRIEARRQ